MITKKCNGCQEEKEAAEFSKDRSKKDGLRTLCKKCTNERVRARYKPKPVDTSFEIITVVREGVSVEVKKCRGCREVKPLSEYYRHKDCKGGVNSRCKTCLGIKGNFTHAKIQYLNIDGKEVEAKDCKTCKKVVPLSEFYAINTEGKRRVGNVESNCKSCSRKYRQELEESDPTRKERRLLMSRQHTQTYKVRRREVDKAYRERNLDKFRVKDANRWARKRLLIDTLTEDQYNEITSLFKNKCALSDGTDLTMDHFIPLSTGHGGTYVGNVYPLESSLNYSKQHLNPFEWIKREDLQERIEKEKWRNLVEYLSGANGMTVGEYEKFVYWCFENPRTLEELSKDNTPSIELYRRTTKRNYRN